MLFHRFSIAVWVRLVKEVVAVIHLARLPSSSYKGDKDLDGIVEDAVREARILEDLGYGSVILENYGDKPYQKRVRDPLTIASMSIAVREVVRSTSLRVGVNLLRNSGKEAYSIAIASGAKFVRINSLVETIVTDSGLIEPEAPRLRSLRINYPWVEIYADLLVKHASSMNLGMMILERLDPQALVSKSTDTKDYLRELVNDYVERGGADKLIVTGLRTGEPPRVELLKLVKELSPVPVLVGSGVNTNNIGSILKHCDGVIVGSFIRRNGKAGEPLDLERARSFIVSVKSHS
ncbi:MAG: BtpA/SgcQ family protein [Sulfolobales archaeon]